MCFVNRQQGFTNRCLFIFKSFGRNAWKIVYRVKNCSLNGRKLCAVYQLTCYIPLDIKKQTNLLFFFFADAIRKLSWSGIPVTVRPTTWQLLCVSLICVITVLPLKESWSCLAVIFIPMKNLFEIQPEIFGFLFYNVCSFNT